MKTRKTDGTAGGRYMNRQYAGILVGRIRFLCAKRGIKINTLSRMSGVSHSTIENMIRGVTFNPRIATLHQIATAFNMTLAEFLDFPELNDYSFDDASRDEGEED